MIGDHRRPEIGADAAIDALSDGTYVLDVREPHEWDEGHAPGATSIPLSELNKRVGEVPTDRPVLVVCHSGMRSARATDALRGVGVDARNVVGGMLAWRDAGGTVVADGGHPGASVD
ncbi:rhodanese-like domain-containing protein [Frigoribacterium sp. 2355]